MALIDKLKEELAQVEGHMEARVAQVREHHAALQDLEAQRADLVAAIAAIPPRIVQVDPITFAENLTPWDGGPCPLPEGSYARVMTRGAGPWSVLVSKDIPLLWEHRGRPPHKLDIVAYREVPGPDALVDPPVATIRSEDPVQVSAGELERVAAGEVVTDEVVEDEIVEPAKQPIPDGPGQVVEHAVGMVIGQTPPPAGDYVRPRKPWPLR